jgi:sigma-E factor negative regulatory protein RseA
MEPRILQDERLGWMNEPLREMVSAFVDGEASELEFRRVLREAGDPDVRSMIRRQYLVRSLMRHEVSTLCPAGLDARISAAIDAEGIPAQRGREGSWRRPAASLAAAASVCFAVVLGTQSFLGTPGGGQVASDGLVAQGATLPVLGPAATQQARRVSAVEPVGFGPAVVQERAGGSGAAGDALAQQRLEVFMLEHAQNAALNTSQGMMPLARVVRYDTP